jgi:PKD repeat protein
MRLVALRRTAALIVALAAVVVLGGCMKNEALIPTACIRAEPTIGYAPLSVAFDASCSYVPAEAAGVYTFVWDFDDGETGTGRTIAHTFVDPGTYNVSVGMVNGVGEPVDGAARVVTVLPAE